MFVWWDVLWEEARAKHWDVWIGMVGGAAAFAIGIFNWEMSGFWLFGALERLVAFGAAPLDGTRGRPTKGVEVGPFGVLA